MEQKPSLSSFSGSPSYYGYAIDVYSEMIPYALGVFDKEGGASCERISNFIREQFNIFPSPSHFTRVSQYLESMTKTGFLLFDNGLYKFHPIRCADDLSAVLARLKSSMSSHPNQRVPMPAPTHTRNPLNVPEYVSKGKEPPRPTCKEVYDVISNIDGINDDEVMRAVKRFVNGKVDEFDMLKSLPNNRKKRSWVLLLINE